MRLGSVLRCLAARCLASLPALPVAHEPFCLLEHVNLNSGEAWTASTDAFFFEVLRCARDTRAPNSLRQTVESRAELGVPTMTGLVWANVGLQQFHLPFGDLLETSLGGTNEQRLRGEVVLSWPRAALDGLHRRVVDWGAAVDVDSSTGALRFVGPFGNRFVVEGCQEGSGWFAPVVSVDAARDALPGGPSQGLGMRAVRFAVPHGTAERICRFYREVLGATSTSVDHVLVAAAEASSSSSSPPPPPPPPPRCTVHVGFGQALEFEETDDDVGDYDGHHVALYLNGDAFLDAYRAATRRGLVFNNPRFPAFTYDTLQDALAHNEFRVKDIIDVDSGERIYELEMELRTLLHPGFWLKSRLVSVDPPPPSEL